MNRLKQLLLSFILILTLLVPFNLSAASPVSAQTCTATPSGLTNWWPGDGNTNDIQNSKNGSLQNGTSFDTGKVAQAFNLDGGDDYISIPDDPIFTDTRKLGDKIVI